MLLNKVLRVLFTGCAISTFTANIMARLGGVGWYTSAILFALMIFSMIGMAITNAEVQRERDSAELRELINNWKTGLKYYSEKQYGGIQDLAANRPQPSYGGGSYVDPGATVVSGGGGYSYGSGVPSPYPGWVQVSAGQGGRGGNSSATHIIPKYEEK